MSANLFGNPPRWVPWALIIGGICAVAFVFKGFPALKALGVPIDAPGFASELGILVMQLIIGGFLAVIIGLVLALKARPMWIIISGAVLLCAGTGPLLVVGVMAQLGLTADPNPNPVGFGILFLFTIFPALLLLVWGIVAWRSEKRAA